MRNYILLTIAVCSLLCGGCKTSPERIAKKTVDAMTSAVTLAMMEWGDYVVKERKASNNDFQRMAKLNHRENQVRSAYEKYQSGMTAIIIGFQSVNSGYPTEKTIRAVAVPVIDLVTSFIK